MFYKHLNGKCQLKGVVMTTEKLFRKGIRVNYVLTAWSFLLVILVAPAFGVAANKSIEIKKHKTIGIGNSLVSIEFDRKTGTMVSLRNVLTSDEYIKNADGEKMFQSFFGVKPDTTMPKGGKKINAKDIKLVDHAFEDYADDCKLRLLFSNKESGLDFEILISLGQNDNYADCELTVINKGTAIQTIMTSFPYLSGLSLGKDRKTNLGVNMYLTGVSGLKAWEHRSSTYGTLTNGHLNNSITMQFDAVYEPSLNEGLGLIVLDREFDTKKFFRSANGDMWVSYYPAEELDSGAFFKYPTTRIMVNKGDWQVIAKEYSKWFHENFETQKTPGWYDELDMASYYHCPDWQWYTGGKDKPFLSDEERLVWFEGFVKNAYLPNQIDCFELAAYFDWSAETDEPSSVRPDLGGNEAMARAFEEVHRMGRKVIVYLGAITYLADAVDKTKPREYWVIMDKPNHELKLYDYMKAHPNFGFRQAAMCPGIEAWQDRIAADAKMLISLGADGLRLDEQVFFMPCFNPAHNHQNPYDSNKWLIQFLSKIRKAMDEVNPEAILSTEFHMDFASIFCNTALGRSFSGYNISPMRIMFPEYKVRVHDYSGAFESALNGWITCRNTYLSTTSPYFHQSEVSMPPDYPEGFGESTRWHEVRPTFREALLYGEVSEVDPVATDDEKWVGHMFESDDYWVMVGGRYDQTALNGTTAIKVSALPAEIEYAFEIDAITLKMDRVEISRRKYGTYINVNDTFSVVFLPKPSCPPLVMYDALIAPPSGSYALRVSLKPFHPWNQSTKALRANVEMPGMQMISSKEIGLPGEVWFCTPSDADPGNYYMKVSGDCLPLKRWMKLEK
jgi:hypothetical protein